MSYELKFLPTALKEWKSLDKTLRRQLKKKLAERLENPHVPQSRLRNFQSAYKIKLKSSGYRLVYEVQEKKVTVLVIAIGRRDKNQVYLKAQKRVP